MTSPKVAEFITNPQIHQYTNMSFPLIYFIDFCMPTSCLFEIAIHTAGVLMLRRVSKLSLRYHCHHKESAGVMESHPGVVAGPGGPGRVQASAKKTPPSLAIVLLEGQS